MRPPFAYFGGKTRLAEQIVAHLPPHEHYVEPFAGSLAVLLAKPRSRMETVNDIDHDLMTFWRVLREQPAELARVCALTPHARAEFLEAYALGLDEPDDIERARRIWVRLAQSRSGTLLRTGWRHYVDPAGSTTSMPGYLEAYVGRMAAGAERLAGVSLECQPALDIIDRYGRSERVLLYVDPPYLGSTRVSGGYRHEMKTEAQHRELAAALRSCAASVVLSGYDSPLYTDLYDGWHVTRIDTTTGQGGTRQDRTEVLWSNRTPEPSLFDLEAS
ncbi:DNA adenine methylase [Prauserella endophytica]|uniref:DNA adenine methylase n=1 Tax=Prauserella endophytica TaxID=1592324 RepID=A0ABY2RS34_9PSEU|nr:DNA adenine methylase [Prauserella endophytica]TKG57951.1 DNA adenine methylase [Prauserella endophytica]